MSNSANSSIVSYGPLPSNYTTGALADMALCAYWQNGSHPQTYPVRYILPNVTLNITFGGTPPFNITNVRYLPYNGASAVCNGIMQFFHNASYFVWTVGDNLTYSGESTVYVPEGDAFVFFAEEAYAAKGVNTSAGYTHVTYPVYPSYYFQVSNNTNSLGITPPNVTTTSTKSAATTSMGWKRGGMALALGLAIFSVL